LATATREGEQQGRLKANAIGVVGAVVISMAFMGPATAVFFNTAPMVAGAGYAVPVSMLLALIVAVLVASSIAGFAQKLPTAGFAYTFNTRGFGKSGGFLSGWLLAFAYAMVGPMLFSGIGAFTAQFFQTQWGINIPWWIFTIVYVVAIWGIGALGITRSVETALIFLVLELAVMLVLFFTILGHSGAHAATLAPFNPANSLKGLSGIGTGLLWAILNFVGFESAATLGEETRDPRRSIPIALFTAVAVIGIYFLLSSFTVAVGFGQSHVGALVKDSTPWSTLANSEWGLKFSWILSITVLNSIFANIISGSNAAVRVLFSMGRERIFVGALGRTTKDGVPLVAITVYMVFSLILSLVGGALWGPFGAYAFYGTILGLGIIIVYILINLALIVFYRRDYPGEFSPLRHGLLPVVASLIMLLPIYGLLYPVPAYPNNLVPYIVAAWIILGAIYLTFTVRNRPEIIDAMGRAMGEEALAPQEQLVTESWTGEEAPSNK
jgi:amino acid transporter